MGTLEDQAMVRLSGALVSVLALGLGMVAGGAPARATGFYEEFDEGPVLVGDRPIVVRNTRALRRQLEVSGGVIAETRYSSFRNPSRCLRHLDRY